MSNFLLDVLLCTVLVCEIGLLPKAASADSHERAAEETLAANAFEYTGVASHSKIGEMAITNESRQPKVVHLLGQKQIGNEIFGQTVTVRGILRVKSVGSEKTVNPSPNGNTISVDSQLPKQTIYYMDEYQLIGTKP